MIRRFVDSLINGKTEYIQTTIEHGLVRVRYGMMLPKETLAGRSSFAGLKPGPVRFGILRTARPRAVQPMHSLNRR
jgi:hypothetical protein